MKTRNEICLTSELALPHCATHRCNGLSLWPSVLHSNANNAAETFIAVYSPDVGRDSHLLPSDILHREREALRVNCLYQGHMTNRQLVERKASTQQLLYSQFNILLLCFL